MDTTFWNIGSAAFGTCSSAMATNHSAWPLLRSSGEGGPEGQVEAHMTDENVNFNDRIRHELRGGSGPARAHDPGEPAPTHDSLGPQHRLGDGQSLAVRPPGREANERWLTSITARPPSRPRGPNPVRGDRPRSRAAHLKVRRSTAGIIRPSPPMTKVTEKKMAESPRTNPAASEYISGPWTRAMMKATRAVPTVNRVGKRGRPRGHRAMPRRSPWVWISSWPCALTQRISSNRDGGRVDDHHEGRPVIPAGR